MKSHFFARLGLVVFVILQLNASASAEYVVKTNRSSYAVAEMVERIIPYFYWDTSEEVFVYSGNVQEVTIIKTDEGVRITYNKKFDAEFNNGPYEPTHIMMLLIKAIAKYDYNSDSDNVTIQVLAEILAYEGISRDQILFFSEKIRELGFSWLNQTQVEQVIVDHRYNRMDILSGNGTPEPAMDAPVLPDEPDLGAGGKDPDPDVEEAPVLSPEPVFESGDVDEDPNNSVVKVYYATNRKKHDHVSLVEDGFADPNDFFSGDREENDRINYGYTLVNIPKIHEKGALERPSVVRLEFWQKPTENPDLHVMLTKIEEYSETEFFDNLKDESEEAKTAFVFVHGFNVNFESAARVVGQLSFDSEFPGTPILFSWPSDGSPASYVSDRTDARHGANSLKNFLLKLVAEGGYETINLVAHSMGNLAMTEALGLFAFDWLSNGGDLTKKPFRELVMYAPDLDVGIFDTKKGIIGNMVEHISVYASDNDKAIHVSTKLNDNPRLGGHIVKLQNNSVVCRGGLMHSGEGFDSIDATNADLGLLSPLNHSYYSESDFVEDFGMLMDPAGRFQTPKSRNLGEPLTPEYQGKTYRFWGFKDCK